MAPYRHHIERRASRTPARQYVSDTHDHKPTATDPAVRRCLRFLRFGAIIRSDNRWRFGMATIGENVIEQLLLDGRAVRTGDRITLAARAARP
ncbi:hypothetical protein [Bradyrhizobium sp. G127]|uniref:hypothetical protein n=1 Tax=Bradyrhizobium sp. G127 TaxID=2904800 RepID=UPI001F438D1D|nr:hypothetical protein [Bradyrhizobium sp. G127]MCF2522338.1 hypothetical protein [Bradyrhizobium sp. G127]